MNSKIWFVLNEGQVTGPYDAAEVESQIDQESGKALQVWGKGQNEWMEPQKWKQAFKAAVAQAQATSDEEVPSWFVSVDGKEYPPLPYTKLIQFLKTLKSLAAVDLKTKSDKVWRDIYTYQRIVDDLGITRRSHPRVPIMGSIQCEAESSSFTARSLSISEGGMGMNQIRPLRMGEMIQITLTSPNLNNKVEAQCEVVYVGNDSYAGLRFVSIPDETKKMIVDYVNKFATV